MMYPRLGYLLSILCALPIALPSSARAYCQATTLETAATCPSTCDHTGLPLSWSARDITYVFNFRGFPGLSDALMRDAFRRAFSEWQGVSCEGRSTGFRFSADPGATSSVGGPRELQPDKNVIVMYSAREWSERGLPARAYALTSLWFDVDTGEIVDSDIQFNGAMGPFTICPDSGCAPEQVDLINVATHEVGHFLGLGHSDSPGSTMWCSAPPTDLGKRRLAEDDRRGLCSIYRRSAGAAGGSSITADGLDVHGGGGCALGPIDRRITAAPLLLSLLVLLLVRGRRGRAAQLMRRGPRRLGPLRCSASQSPCECRRGLSQPRPTCPVRKAD